jgi:hypothetical protein
MENIPAVANSPPQVNSAEFVKITIYNEYGNTANTTVFTASSSYTDETIDGTTFNAAGGLLAVGSQQKDIRVTSADTTVALSGFTSGVIGLVLDSKIRGSKLEIWRGFYNDQGVLTSNAKRFTGIITGYNIEEDRVDLEDNFTVAVSASNYKTVLENRLASRRTNPESWESFDSTDSSMTNIYSIATQTFDFGKEPKYVSGGRGGGGGGGGGGGRGGQQQR